MASIKCGNCTATHASVAEVKGCYSGKAQTEALERELGQARVVVDYPISVPAEPKAEIFYPASEKQVAFIKRLADERDWSLADRPTAEAITGVVAGKTIAKKDASNAITFLQGCVRKTAEPTAPSGEVGLGMYLKDGRYFRVYKARSGSHRLAKELVRDYDESDDWSFVYRGGPKKLGLREEHRLSLEAAKEFGQQYGVCCVCGAFLSDPESVAAGIGPICGGRMASGDWA